MLKIVLLSLHLVTFASSRVVPNLDAIRTNMMMTEEKMLEGGSQTLTEKEILVDNLIRNLKREELNAGLRNLSTFAPAMHFFQAKPLIERSKIFEIIKKIPKGASLHVHNTASVSTTWIIRNLTYRPEAEYCTNSNGLTIFTAGDHKNCVDEAVNIQQRRFGMNFNQIRDFDAWLSSKISLVNDNPSIKHSNINEVWTEFEEIFDTIENLLTFLPFYKDYHYRMLQEFYDDGIFYTEFRTSFNELYDNFGNFYDHVQSAGVLYDVVREFGVTHSNFVGAKAIYSVFRRSDEQKLAKRVTMFTQVKMNFPNFVIGFDFVGQEDLGVPLICLQQVIGALPPETQFFFHAGETNWWGTSIDFNIIDAILFNTTRIGHGYALLKHPLLWNTVLTKNIAIEVSVISNQVLHLVSDLRNHPAAIYFALNLPVVITNDDPSFWNALGLSYDWYYAFMSLSPATSGLKFLKQLSLNSIKFSILSAQERMKMEKIFSVEWDRFLNEILQRNSFK
ncbi:adenosine deaminase 2-like [Culicoides brevitarsis]|uniref:adenosine deaminase 2-like n=1 Tax=Culicoides brevitarsis TaxID=469753 RepID=UPI00307C99F8